MFLDVPKILLFLIIFSMNKRAHVYRGILLKRVTFVSLNLKPDEGQESRKGLVLLYFWKYGGGGGRGKKVENRAKCI